MDGAKHWIQTWMKTFLRLQKTWVERCHAALATLNKVMSAVWMSHKDLTVKPELCERTVPFNSHHEALDEAAPILQLSSRSKMSSIEL
ncbi:hypothetical protein CHARACLAT_018127 [Characodon lateralis]|uniref:Uncharacterized protein n=1 Tax=Characodon lateralis TaxID=208331 RepID=A0ABU7D9U8_9TELE|nr:hypothetical protein [Characodon lateralis]